MAFKTIVAGDVFNPETQVFPYKPKAGYTPVQGDLVINDTTVDCGVDLIAANENAIGMVIKFENGIVSVWRFLPGTRVVLPYSGVLAQGDKVEGDGGTHNTTIDRSTVRVDNTNGTGNVISVDANTAYGTGFAVVEY